MLAGRSPRRFLTSARELRRRAGIEPASRRLLLGVIVPLWIGGGLLDWLCHRRSDIEHTAGTHEALVHALMMSEAGGPVMLASFFEVNAGLIAYTLAALACHQLTAVWDVSYAESRREVTQAEQHVHGILEQVPVMATAFILALHWDQARALLGVNGEPRRFKLEPKRQPISRRARVRLLAAVALFGVAPYAEEIMRCRRVDPGLQPHGEAEPALSEG